MLAGSRCAVKGVCNILCQHIFAGKLYVKAKVIIGIRIEIFVIVAVDADKITVGVFGHEKAAVL